MKIFLKSIKNVWIIAGITLVCVFAFELSARMLYALKDRGAGLATLGFLTGNASQRDYITWEPYSYWKSRPFASDGINVDADGNRKTVQPAVGSDAATKIFMFGGSALWGLYVFDHETIPSLVAQELAGRGFANFDIKNFAQIGYVSTQELIQLMMLLRKGTIPDIVIFYDGVNDTWSAFQNRVAGWPLNEENRRKEFEGYATGAMLIRQYVEKSALLRAVKDMRTAALKIQAKLFPGLRPAHEKVEECDSALIAQTIDTYGFTMNLARLLAREYGFECFFFWQPTVFSTDSITAPDNFNKQKYSIYTAFFNCAYAKAPLLARRGHNFYDLQKILSPAEEQLFFDFCHTKPNANKTIARHIADRVAAHSKKLLRNR